MSCPCDGKTEYVNKKVIIKNINCGLLKVEICHDCGSEYYDEDVQKLIENRLIKAYPRKYHMNYLPK